MNLQEALDEFLTREPEISFDLHDHLRLILAAARSVVEGTNIGYCTTHHQSAVRGGSACQWALLSDALNVAHPASVVSLYADQCRIVSRRLVVWEDTK